MRASLVETNIRGTDLTDCYVYGISAWRLELDENTIQRNLIVTPHGEPRITVDNIEVAQFIYLILHNEKIRDVIDTIGKKAVLILGRFTDERNDPVRLRCSSHAGHYRDSVAAGPHGALHHCRPDRPEQHPQGI